MRPTSSHLPFLTSFSSANFPPLVSYLHPCIKSPTHIAVPAINSITTLAVVSFLIFDPCRISASPRDPLSLVVFCCLLPADIFCLLSSSPRAKGGAEQAKSTTRLPARASKTSKTPKRRRSLSQNGSSTKSRSHAHAKPFSKQRCARKTIKILAILQYPPGQTRFGDGFWILGSLLGLDRFPIFVSFFAFICFFSLHSFISFSTRRLLYCSYGSTTLKQSIFATLFVLFVFSRCIYPDVYCFLHSLLLLSSCTLLLDSISNPFLSSSIFFDLCNRSDLALTFTSLPPRLLPTSHFYINPPLVYSATTPVLKVRTTGTYAVTSCLSRSLSLSLSRVWLFLSVSVSSIRTRILGQQGC